ncbi:hypothetical protein [Mycobacterium sp.]|uniref:hypothetical protein n=1 Tax=Mycobacterium sp. TaxID=1785 RepID=UPI002D1A5B56|nr:hypothetical protein [Mycobacterium sp.]HME47724.1 hypothetical protein [Mycobacterium sp.]
MWTRFNYLMAAGAAAAIFGAPAAVADDTNPTCTDVGGGTECSTPGNVQINASPPVDDGIYPIPYWDDVWGGPTVQIGGGGGVVPAPHR